ncbi:hypothetical protein EDC04DRAFT_2617149 [Pisolithus marmoratus]|nr:hypothetical protein EDC04DRAFT_2617149 [Pisolithus marmoratus]
MSINTKSKQPGCLDFGVIEESLGDLHTGLTCVECWQIDNEAKLPGKNPATSLKDMQDSLDELDRAVTTFRQEINLKMSCKSGRVTLLMVQFSCRNTFDGAKRMFPTSWHGKRPMRNLSEGLKEMKVLFSLLQDKIKEVGAEVAWAQTMVPSLQNDLCAAVGHGTVEMTEIRKPIPSFLIKVTVHDLGNCLSAGTFVIECQGWGSLTLLSKITDQIPMVMQHKILVWGVAASVCVFSGLCASVPRWDFTEMERPVWHALRHQQNLPAGFHPGF